MREVQERIGVAPISICGGTPRDRYLGHLENIEDLDLTNGTAEIDYLSQELYIELRKKYKLNRVIATDGHSSINFGSFKMDFSSNFNAPNIDKLLMDRGIKNPTDIQKEMFSRDFTCNALLLSLDLKQLTDPTCRGFKDIKDRTIRTCLAPEITLTTNKNRVIRSIYLATKLDFDIDPAIIDFVKKNPQSVRISTNKVLVEKVNKAFENDADRASALISKMGIWGYIPITEKVKPYYMNRTKVAYFQGGGGANEPSPGKTKYKADDAITVQPRFVEPFYRNYDLYYTEGVDGKPVHSPGVGWHSVMDYGSIKEYLEETRKFLRGKYVADDSYITEDNYKEREKRMKIRAELLNELIKNAHGDHFKVLCRNCGSTTAQCRCIRCDKEVSYVDSCSACKNRMAKNSQRNFDYGKGLYENMDKYDSVKDFLGDENKLDFPYDDIESGSIIGNNSEEHETPRNLGPAGPPFDTSILPSQTNIGDFDTYPYSAQLGGLMDKYLPQNDFGDKKPEELDFGRDYSDGNEDLSGRCYETGEGELATNYRLEELIDKYLNPAPTHGLYGLPDGVDLPDGDLGVPRNINPYYGTSDVGITMYEDKWNI